MRNKFDEQLELLNVELIRMGALCEDAISQAAKTLSDPSDALREAVSETEREIDRKEREIEALCMRLLLQQQPVARDLRMISAALKMISDMERIGDQAADIAEIAVHVTPEAMASAPDIMEMARATIQMVTDSVDSYVRHDLALSEAVVQYDDVVDDLFSRVKNALVERITAADTDGEACIDLLLVAKYFERIGDHAVNLAEWVEYTETGRMA